MCGLCLHIYLYFFQNFLKCNNMSFHEFFILLLEASMELRLQKQFRQLKRLLPLRK